MDSVGKSIFSQMTEIELLFKDWPLTTCFGARISTIKFFARHLTEFIGNMPPPTTTRAFVGYLSFFLEKFLQADSRINHLASKMCLEPCWINVRELKIWGRERVRVRDLTWSFWACSEKKKKTAWKASFRFFHQKCLVRLLKKVKPSPDSKMLFLKASFIW